MFLSSGYYKHSEYWDGVKDALSAAPGLSAWALMTGVAMMNSGMGLYSAMLMSFIVYAGSTQLAVAPLMMVGAPAWVVLATALCVNLRFAVFSAHMRAYMMHLPTWQRLLSGYLTTDTSYVFFTERFPKAGTTKDECFAQQAYLAGNHGAIWVSWMACAFLGIAFANIIPVQWGLGFAGSLALLAIMCSLASSKLRLVSAGVAALVGVLCVAMPFKLNILVAIGVAVAACLGLEKSDRLKGGTS